MWGKKAKNTKFLLYIYNYTINIANKGIVLKPF